VATAERSWRGFAAAIIALTLAGSGCTGALDGLGNRSFAASPQDVLAAAKVALDRLSVAVDRDRTTDTGRWIYAHTPDRSINIQVEQVASGSTRMSVVANGTAGASDRATAAAIIAQTAAALEARVAGRPARAAKTVEQSGGR
jgi:hypothetical protein